MKEDRVDVPKGQGDEIETPPWLFKYLNNIYQFQRDVCATRENCLVPHNFIFASDRFDALNPDHTWSSRNYMNPPYSNPKPFLQRAFQEAMLHDRLTVALIKGDPSVSWWTEVVEPYADVTWIPFRVRFFYQGKPCRHVANFPSTIAVFMPPLMKEMQDEY